VSAWTRPLAVRRGGAFEVTVALVLVAVSGASLLAAGPRILDTKAFSGLALEWTLSTIFGFGVATPTEQLINRRRNVGQGLTIGPAVRSLVVAGSLVLVATMFLLGNTTAAHRFPWLVPGSSVVVIGWVWCAISRGRLLGAGDLRAYGRSQFIEGASRILLVLAAVIAGGPWPAFLLASAVGIPLFLAGAWGAMHRTHDPTGAQLGIAQRRQEHSAFVVVALGYQFCLSAPPLLLAWKVGAGQPAVIGAFVMANTFFRAPVILSGGTLVAALTTLSRLWGVHDIEAFIRHFAGVVGRSVLIVGLATACGGAVAPVALPILYGGPLGLPVLTSVALAVSTVVAVVASACTTALLVMGHGGQAVAAWGLGSVVMAVVSITAPIDVGVMGWALVSGPLTALVLASIAMRLSARTQHASIRRVSVSRRNTSP
jgi:O-antigen/teichoic acid export membrane protein